MRLFTLAMLTLAALAAGCSGYMVRPMPVHPVTRVYKAAVDETWTATLDSLRGLPLQSIDKSSGYVITDWQKGLSDHRYFGTPERVEWWQQVRFKITVSVKPAKGGTLVTVDLYEETNFPRRVYNRSTWSRGPHGMRSGLHGGLHGPSFEVERLDSWEVDEWIPTPSSTAKEKELLDRIEYALLSRG